MLNSMELQRPKMLLNFLNQLELMMMLNELKTPDTFVLVKEKLETEDTFKSEVPSSSTTKLLKENALLQY